MVSGSSPGRGPGLGTVDQCRRPLGLGRWTRRAEGARLWEDRRRTKHRAGLGLGLGLGLGEADAPPAAASVLPRLPGCVPPTDARAKVEKRSEYRGSREVGE